MYIKEADIQGALKEAKATNVARSRYCPGKYPIPIMARIYFTDVIIIRNEVFEIAKRLAEHSPYKRWVRNFTSVQGFPMQELYEVRWSVGLVGLEVYPVYLGPYMPQAEAQQKAEEYNKFLEVGE